ncbi:response regulator [Chitinivibrio alkaliphilus]|uniref:histidine kinase n=1 Tax=Chitinivibrio alkaliphilus ACht1 TaxID=1313304 RepID=U7DCG3_9BACT|nr:response regulator [Chitinivibrio alkaliphilus]ERP39263.1 two-component system sensor histidine kinase/response regulator hybrid [Chitinivibrio alkaliphilus ACht1]
MHILITDDDPVSRKILHSFLLKRGYGVSQAQSGEEAYELLLKSTDLPNIAIIDWVMPGMNGINLMRNIRALPGGEMMYIVLLTSREEGTNISQAISAGADDYITKPFRSRVLEARLEAGKRIVELHQRLHRETMRAEEAAEEARAALQVKDTFLANMSHELRTPLSGIVGFSRLLRKTNLTETQEKYINSLSLSADTLQHLINTILNYTRLNKKEVLCEKSTHDITEIVKIVTLLTYGAAAEKNIEIILDVDPLLPNIVEVPYENLLQVLSHLLDNAVKFTPEGFVMLKVRGKKLKNRTCEYVFSVVDTGIGIDTSKEHLIFNSFTQIDSSSTKKYGGSGLGLSVAKRLTEKMQGTLSFVRNPRRGVTFSCTLQLTYFDTSTYINFPQEIENCLVLGQSIFARSLTNTLRFFQLEINSITDQKGFKTHLCNNIYDMALIDYNYLSEDAFEEILSLKETDKQKYRNVPFVFVAHLQNFNYLNRVLRSLKSCYVLAKPITLYSFHNLIHNAPKNKTCENIKILLADDSSLIRDLTREVLEQAFPHADIYEACDGAEFVSLFKETRPDFSFLDIQMPRGDGFTVMNEVAPLRTPEQQFFALTAYEAGSIREKCTSLGIKHVLKKPLTLKKLQALRGEYEKHRMILSDDGREVYHFNRATLLKRLRNNRLLYHQIMDTFITQFQQQCQEIQRAVLANDLCRAKQIGHAMIGAAESLEMRRLAALLRQANQSESCADMERLCSLVQDEYDLVRSIVLEGE